MQLYAQFITTDLNKLVAKVEKRITRKSASKTTTFRGYRRIQGDPLNSEPSKIAPMWTLKPEYRYNGCPALMHYFIVLF